MRPWRRIGRLFEASGRGRALSHAMLPTPYLMADRLRVYFASCDTGMRGRVFFADLEPVWPHAVMAVSRDPVLDLGEGEAFDVDGVNPSQVIEADGRLHLLYIGWRRGPSVEPYTLFAGLATSADGGTGFIKAAGPLLPPRPDERLFRTAPFVERHGDGWRMLYIGGDRFVGGGAKPLPLYGLREACSPTLARWSGPGEMRLAPDQEAGEIGYGRPVAWREAEDAPSLILSVRTRNGYRLVQGPWGPAATGRPALEDALAGEPQAWEREMTCFGAPCVADGRELLFYNGDGFGRTGVGLAWRERS